MDFSVLRETIASKSYDKIADICDELLLQVAAEGINFQEEWPYAIHLLGHIYLNDVNNARFLWKSIPKAIKESKPEIAAAWKIGQHLWNSDYAGVHEAIHGYEWSPEVEGLVMALSGKFFFPRWSILSLWVRVLWMGMGMVLFIHSFILVLDHFIGLLNEMTVGRKP